MVVYKTGTKTQKLNLSLSTKMFSAAYGFIMSIINTYTYVEIKSISLTLPSKANNSFFVLIDTKAHLYNFPVMVEIQF